MHGRGNSLFLVSIPKFAPPDAYDYHQPLPMPDPEAPEQDFGNCSICMEPIVVAQGTSSTSDKHPHATESSTPLGAAASGVGHVGSKVMSMNIRRTYALAPCHHLFHTECLSQWLAIKVSSGHSAASTSTATNAHRYRTLARFVRGVCHHYRAQFCIIRHVSIEHSVSSCTFHIISSINSIVGVSTGMKQQHLPSSGALSIHLRLFCRRGPLILLLKLGGECVDLLVLMRESDGIQEGPQVVS